MRVGPAGKRGPGGQRVLGGVALVLQQLPGGKHELLIVDLLTLADAHRVHHAVADEAGRLLLL